MPHADDRRYCTYACYPEYDGYRLRMRLKQACNQAAIENDGPFYIRQQTAFPVINDRDSYKFELGKGITIKDGSDITIITME